MAIPLTDNWAMPSGSAPALPPAAGPAPTAPGATTPSAAPAAISFLGDALQTLPLLFDKRATGTQKVAALMQMEQQRKAQQQNKLIKSYGAELAQVLDTNPDAKTLKGAVNGLVKKYTAQGGDPQAMMKVTSDFMSYVHNQRQETRQSEEWRQKQEQAKRGEAARTAMRDLTQSAPDPANYAPGSFKALGVGSPTGIPSQAPDTAAGKSPAKGLADWIKEVRQNPDIPYDKKELFIKQITGQDPETQRKLLLKGAGTKGGVKYSDLLNKQKYEALQRIANGTATAEDYVITNKEMAPYVNKAAQAIFMNPSVFSMTTEQVGQAIAQNAKVLQDQVHKSMGIPTIKDRQRDQGNFKKYRDMLRGGTK